MCDRVTVLGAGNAVAGSEKYDGLIVTRAHVGVAQLNSAATPAIVIDNLFIICSFQSIPGPPVCHPHCALSA
jgi:hypothetical protein